MHKLQGVTFDSQSFLPSDIKVPGVSWRPVAEFKLLQWVYLSDNDGVEVYEGDYIKISSIVYKVVWNETVVNFELHELDSSLSRSIIDVSLGELVGNEFENPSV